MIAGEHLMQKAEHGDRVRVHYTGTLEDGTEFDSSRGRETLEFVLGEGKVIKGFDDAVNGMAPAETCTVAIPAGEAYGMHRDDMVMEVDRDQFPVDVPLQQGQHYRFDSNDGSTVIMRVVEMNEQTVTLDGNHPLAGDDLKFEIELVEICS